MNGNSGFYLVSSSTKYFWSTYSMPRIYIINEYILKININCFGAGKWKNCLLVFYVIFIFSSVQFIHSVVSDYLRPSGLRHARLACPSPTPGAYLNSWPLSWWCHPTISSSVIPFSSCLQLFPASGSFPVSQFFTSGSQRIGVSALASILPMSIQDWISLQLKGLNSLHQQHSSKTSVLLHSAFSMDQLTHPYMTTGKNIALTRQNFVGQVMSLLFNMVSSWIVNEN